MEREADEMDPALQTLFVDPVEKDLLEYVGEYKGDRWWNGFLVGSKSCYQVIRGIADFVGWACKEGPFFKDIGTFLGLWDKLWGMPEVKSACEEIACVQGPILEVAAGLGGGFVPGLLKLEENLIILMNDLDIRVLEDWRCFSSRGVEKIGRSLSFSAFDAKQMPIREGSFSAVTSLGGFSNIDSDHVSAVREAFRVLRRGGLLCILEGWFSKKEISSFMPDAIDDMERSPPGLLGEEGWESALKEAGFKVLEKLDVSSPFLRYYSNQILLLFSYNRLEPKFSLLKAIKP